MLKVESFKMSDDIQINNLLSKYRLAPNMHILVSEGNVIIPYEDGEPANKSQRISSLKELREQERAKLGVIEHSQAVLQAQIDDIVEQLAELDTKSPEKGSKEAYKASKETKEAKEHLEHALRSRQSNQFLNTSEVARMKLEIRVYDDTIADIESFEE